MVDRSTTLSGKLLFLLSDILLSVELLYFCLVTCIDRSNVYFILFLFAFFGAASVLRYDLHLRSADSGYSFKYRRVWSIITDIVVIVGCVVSLGGSAYVRHVLLPYVLAGSFALEVWFFICNAKIFREPIGSHVISRGRDFVEAVRELDSDESDDELEDFDGDNYFFETIVEDIDEDDIDETNGNEDIKESIEMPVNMSSEMYSLLDSSKKK